MPENHLLVVSQLIDVNELLFLVILFSIHNLLVKLVSLLTVVFYLNFSVDLLILVIFILVKLLPNHITHFIWFVRQVGFFRCSYLIMLVNVIYFYIRFPRLIWLLSLFNFLICFLWDGLFNLVTLFVKVYCFIKNTHRVEMSLNYLAFLV